jgi:nucleoside-diphosphate-sugar epimerase
MKVLLTGAFGLIGTNAIGKLVEQGHQVRCFDLRTRASERTAQRYKNHIELMWGDVRRPDDVATAVHGQDVIIHLAFVLPPASEDRPEWAREINIGGTRNLLNAMKALSSPPKIIFASSFVVFGPTYNQPPPRTISDPVQPMDNYSRHKIECEKLVKESGGDWVIFRLGGVAQLSLNGFNPKMFDFSLDARIEFADPRDVGLALANVVSCDEVWGRTLLIGSGPSGQLYYRDFFERMMNAVGIGMLPDRAFNSEPFLTYTDWMDTTESQMLLNYQQHSFEDFVQDLSALLGYKRYLMPLLRPIVRWWMIKQSPYYRSRS